MGVTAAMYAWGFQYENPNKPYDMNGYVNSDRAVEALEFYKKIYKECTPPGHSDAYMEANLDAYKSGQVAMQMNWYAFWPGVNKDPDVGEENQVSSQILTKKLLEPHLVVKECLLFPIQIKKTLLSNI